MGAFLKEAIIAKQKNEADAIWSRWMATNLNEKGVRQVTASLHGDRLAAPSSSETEREIKNRTFDEERDEWLKLKSFFSKVK